MDSIASIKRWCTTSVGQPIDVGGGARLSFAASQPWEEAELRELERDLELQLPETFRSFAVEVGKSHLFVDQHGLGLHFYGPQEVREVSESVWEDWVAPQDPVRRSLLLVGDGSGLGDYFGWALSLPFPDNFDVFCHEEPPTEWVAASTETGSWQTFDDWLNHLVETLGEPL